MRTRQKKIMRTSYVFIAIFCFIVTALLILRSGYAVPAQIADNLLRPVIGSKNTIMLESYYFDLEDQWAKITYHFFGQQKAVVFEDKETTDELSTQSALLSLTPLVIDSTLPALPNEGKWQPIPEKAFPNETVLAQTFIRPDPTRPYAIVSLVYMDMQKLGLGAVAGTYYPGGEHKVYGPGIVPPSVQKANTLLAVFNGGFQEKDGHYGMIVGSTTYVPLRAGLATLVMKQDGSFSMIDYQNQPIDPSVVSIRQNGVFLIRNGSITPFVENSLDTWGRTTTNSFYTWRSGIGITNNGNLVYAVGNSLIPKTLAIALQKAGAINAMQLDINPFWVRYILYTSLGNGKYSYVPLTNQLQNGGYQYLHGYNKDFFYIYKK